MPLTVLITNICMDTPSGTVVYTRDLALELRRQGHRPLVHTWSVGPASDELVRAGIPVRTDFRFGVVPDVIHGHHRPLVFAALRRYPSVPAVFVCHDHTSPWDGAPRNERVRRFFGVSAVCVDRLLRDGAPPERTSPQLNSVDLERFRPRPPLPAEPGRALMFSNYARRDGYLPAVQEGCRRRGLELDVAGEGVGKLVAHPEDVIGRYDIVFAKAKAAMEAMAVGSAVVLCDFAGLGPMVTEAEFERLRPLNFGFAALTEPVGAEGVARRIEAYDAADAARVRDRLRAVAGLDLAARTLVAAYEEVIAEQAAAGGHRREYPSFAGRLDLLRYALASRALRVYYARRKGGGADSLPRPLRPVYHLARATMRRLLWSR